MTEDISPRVKTLESNYLYKNIIEPTQNIALFIGEFEKGDINSPQLISNELEFKHYFGRAMDFNFNDWYQVYNYLQYPGNPQIYVCRTAGRNNKKASNNGNIANSPGVWGNLLTVEIYSKNQFNDYLKNIFGFYSYLEVTEEYMILIKRKEQIVENFMLSYNKDLKSNYLEQINLETGIFKLYGGNSEQPTESDYRESFEIFSKENYEIDIVISPEDYNEVVIDYVESRKDCIGFLGIPRKFIDFLYVNGVNLATEDGKLIIFSMAELKYKLKNSDYSIIKEYINSLKRSTYCIMCFGFKVQIDGFSNDKKIINTIGDIAGLKAKASSRTPWGIGAGIEKGKIQGFEDFVMKVNKTESDILYELGVNVLSNGTLMSQKLFIEEDSKVNRVHQRNIFNYLERATEKLTRKYLFLENNRQLRGQVATEIKIILEDMLSSGGIESGKVYVTSENIKNVEKIIININIKIPGIIEFVKIQMHNIGGDFNIVNEFIGE